MADTEEVFRLGLALVLGMLIGLERGWHTRSESHGARIAGIRTFGLIGLFGAVSTLIAIRLGGSILGYGIVAIAIVFIVARYRGYGQTHDASITSVIAALVTFAFGASVMLRMESAAATGAVLTVIVLGAKPVLHRWVRSLSNEELVAGAKLLLISVVVLPILPNHGFGPWQAFNPYEIWWMVVLISAISFVGYFAVRVFGADRGLMFAAFFAGLTSSTALTLHYSRLSRAQPGNERVLAAGILVACGTMFPRILVLVVVIAPELLRQLLMPTLLMSACLFLPAAWYWRAASQSGTHPGTRLNNPLELGWAIRFGLFLALIMFAATSLKHTLGAISIVWLAAASGIADVDAIVLSVARMFPTELASAIVLSAIIVASASNNIVKAGMTLATGNRHLFSRVAAPLVISAATGIALSLIPEMVSLH